MEQTKNEISDKYLAAAAAFIENSKGLNVIASDYKTSYGDIDLVAIGEDKKLHFIDVVVYEDEKDIQYESRTSASEMERRIAIYFKEENPSCGEITFDEIAFLITIDNKALIRAHYNIQAV